MENETISFDGTPLRFESKGAGDPALVFVHGWSCDRSYWRMQVGHFAERRRVVAIDLAGHGASGSGRADWSMPSFAEDVVAVAEHLELERMVLVGHSMGADIVTLAALRLGDRVAGVVWLDQYFTLGSPRTPEQVQALVEPLRRDHGSETRNLVGRMFAPTSDAVIARWVADDMAAAPVDIALDVFIHAITFEPQLVAALPELDAPVVAINADRFPTDVEALKRYGVETVIMSGVGHFLMLEDPSRFNRQLEEVVDGFVAGSRP